MELHNIEIKTQNPGNYALLIDGVEEKNVVECTLRIKGGALPEIEIVRYAGGVQAALDGWVRREAELP